MSDRVDLALVDIEDWLDSEGIEYRGGSSDQFNLRDCPFCGGSKWKVRMRRDDGRGTCFSGSCQTGFNLFSFARAHLSADNRAVFAHFETYLAAGAPQSVADAPAPLAVSTPSATWQLPLSTPLPTPDGQTHPHLLARKITLETQRLFGLRYCHEGLYPYVDNDGNERAMDFSRRIIIPVFDLDGSLQTFQGRDVTGESEKRYIFPPLLPGSGRFLYGANLAIGKEHVVIGEGCFDVQATHQAIDGIEGFENTAAIGSFGLSIGHSNVEGNDQLGRLRQLKQQGLKRITFLWDAEANAIKHAIAAGKMLRGEGFKVSIGLLPPDTDPNEVESRCVREAIKNATVLTDMIAVQWSLRSPL